MIPIEYIYGAKLSPEKKSEHEKSWSGTSSPI